MLKKNIHTTLNNHTDELKTRTTHDTAGPQLNGMTHLHFKKIMKEKNKIVPLHHWQLAAAVHAKKQNHWLSMYPTAATINKQKNKVSKILTKDHSSGLW